MTIKSIFSSSFWMYPYRCLNAIHIIVPFDSFGFLLHTAHNQCGSISYCEVGVAQTRLAFVTKYCEEINVTVDEEASQVGLAAIAFQTPSYLISSPVIGWTNCIWRKHNSLLKRSLYQLMLSCAPWPRPGIGYICTEECWIFIPKKPCQAHNIIKGSMPLLQLYWPWIWQAWIILWKWIPKP